ncbi:co-chaperone YbbN [Microtetraspora sp. NBRC 13810]|uniref:tetratricopeptide repeat protein n=1 Tax=Microtetraspora sp. NBRC 13810 TaxID=3030990 RepID=UPI0024A1384B|nr:tetratricopeptide repeat protein [Microtetraspora sp. NBRC 13810]GLW05076.1 co-chaperone YbbN [Microtetraspora sp. NBRC 13810]
MSPADFNRPGSLYGAVDLGARKQALEAQARREAVVAQGGQAGAAAASVVDVTDDSFSADVIERSMRVPVILDLWATWCEPCKQLSPILEKLAAEAGGKWLLAKVDVDANPQISQALRVQSIPTVLAIFQGQAVTGFQGAMPEAQVRQWLDQLMEALAQYLPPDDQEAAPGQEEGAADQPRIDPDLAAAEQAIDAGDLAAAAGAYERLLARSPGNEDAKMGLAGISLIQRAEGLDEAAVRARAADGSDVEAQCQMADLEMLTGAVEAAFERLIGTIRRTAGADRDKARVHLLGLFETLPSDDPALAAARRALASALF